VRKSYLAVPLRLLYNPAMAVIADLHIHSRYSRATSPKLTVPHLERWARIKGIGLVGTGDCTHPRWLAELRDQLEGAEEGLYRIRPELRGAFDGGPALAEELPRPSPASSDPAMEPRFVLTGEISTIYSRDGKTRKVHHLVLLPDFDAALRLQVLLERRGNIASDGRPILGLDSRDLFSILLEADPRSLLIPAHIWTPWFSALGARSGFDSLAECYGDLAELIPAIETGLSSNPPMNWAVSSLDPYAIISNSDAHSPEKLGREATVLQMDLSYPGLASALRGASGVLETIEFFPQEGKYHYDGHRTCGVVLTPEESLSSAGLCPSCGKPLTQGVLARVAELSDRPLDEFAPCPEDAGGTRRRPYRSLIPLSELLGQVLGCGPGSKKVAGAYRSLVEAAGSEYSLLAQLPLREIRDLRCQGLSSELLTEAVRRMRSGEVAVSPGYDGVYGQIRVVSVGGLSSLPALFEAAEIDPPAEAPSMAEPAPASKPSQSPPRLPQSQEASSPKGSPKGDGGAAAAAQREAMDHRNGPALVVAGPGTGKTWVLTQRIAALLDEGIDGDTVLALTFTNKAAEELRGRLRVRVGEIQGDRIWAGTFHSFCLSVLRECSVEAGLPDGFGVIPEVERESLLRRLAGDAAQARRLGAYIESRKRLLLLPAQRAPQFPGGATGELNALAAELGVDDLDVELDGLYWRYREALKDTGTLDFDDLMAGTVRLLAARPSILATLRNRYPHICVDEYQDVNFAQYALIRLLAPHRDSDLFVIGDPNQAIYSFRGADPRFIARFPTDYPGAASYRLVKSFRCAPAIIGAASSLVGSTLEGSGDCVALSRIEYPSEKAEAEGIARTIARLVGGTGFFSIDSGVVGEGGLGSVNPGQCAVLVRASSLAPAMVKALCDHGLPYRLIGERPWWEKGKAAEIIAELKAWGADSEQVSRHWSSLKGKSLETLKNDELDDLERLRALASFHDDPRSFLDYLTLGSSGDAFDAGENRVAVMTIHASKGLEFDHVFVPALEDGIHPFTLRDHVEGDELAESRRLLYVAMTRAKRGLYLSSARRRTLRGRSLELPPSPFLRELSASIEEGPRPELGGRKNPQLGLF